jgi:predicted DNA binding CopG/RHH family protein
MNHVEFQDVTLRLPKPLVTRLEEEAKIEGVTISQLIREIFNHG